MQSQLRFLSLDHLFLQCLLGFHSLREISGYFSETKQLATVVPYRCDDHIRPKSGPILAHAPTFVFESPVLGRHRQFPLRLTVSQIFFRVKPGKVPADDLGSSVALQALGSFVPAAHVALSV